MLPAVSYIIDARFLPQTMDCRDGWRCRKLAGRHPGRRFMRLGFPGAALIRLAVLGVLLAPASWPQRPSPSAPPPTAPDPNAALHRAIELYEQKSYAAALPLFEQMAGAGNLEASRYLGVMYGAGQGVARDYDEALRWSRKAAFSGDSQAMCNIGSLYVEGM